jgi:hypothetical protein
MSNNDLVTKKDLQGFEKTLARIVRDTVTEVVDTNVTQIVNEVIEDKVTQIVDDRVTKIVNDVVEDKVTQIVNDVVDNRVTQIVNQIIDDRVPKIVGNTVGEIVTDLMQMIAERFDNQDGEIAELKKSVKRIEHKVDILGDKVEEHKLDIRQLKLGAA